MRSSCAVAKVAAVARDQRGDGKEGRKSDDGDPDDDVAASTRIDHHRECIEWVRSDSADGEISRFVSGGEPTATVTRNNHPRRCCRTSSSSGYSSHSPPLSAGSYSYYASATSALMSASLSTRGDPYGGLAVIHESETIPRPVWPSAIYHHAEDRRNVDYKGIYTCRVCDSTYNYPLPPPSSPLPPGVSAREVLLELSRTLNSVIDGDRVTATPEDVLRDISRIVSLGIGVRNDDGIYEYVRSPRAFDDKDRTSRNCAKHVPSRVNPVNSKLYVGGYRCLYDSVRSPKTENWTDSTGTTLNPRETSYVCGEQYLNDRRLANNAKQLSFGLDSERCENGFSAAAESKYSMQLRCSDVGTSSEETIASSKAKNWNPRLAVKDTIGDFDFTLDVTRAEHLGRTIARAKRKRRWCRILTVLLGLVFFVLSVVVVSLSVTRGRKVFGSM